MQLHADDGRARAAGGSPFACESGRARPARTPRCRSSSGPGAGSALTRVAARLRGREPGALAGLVDQPGSKHTGDSRNRRKGGQPVCVAVTTPDRRSDGDAHSWRGGGLLPVRGGLRPCLRGRTGGWRRAPRGGASARTRRRTPSCERVAPQPQRREDVPLPPRRLAQACVCAPRGSALSRGVALYKP